MAPTPPGNIVIELKGSRKTRLVTGMSDVILVNTSQFSIFFVDYCSKFELNCRISAF